RPRPGHLRRPAEGPADPAQGQRSGRLSPGDRPPLRQPPPPPRETRSRARGRHGRRLGKRTAGRLAHRETGARRLPRRPFRPAPPDGDVAVLRRTQLVADRRTAPHVRRCGPHVARAIASGARPLPPGQAAPGGRERVMTRSCSDFQLDFWMAVDGDLPEAESKALAAHLRDCDRCREAVRGAAQTHRVLLESLLDPAVRRPQEKPVTRRTARSFRAPSDSPWKVFLIAAGVLVGIVAVLFMATDSSQNPEAEVRRARRAAEERRNQLRQEQAHMERARLDAEEKLAALRKEQDRLDLERKSSPPPPSEDLRKKA